MLQIKPSTLPVSPDRRASASAMQSPPTRAEAPSCHELLARVGPNRPDPSIAGHERFVGFIAGQTLARLFALVGLYTNFFQPSFKLISKQRYGARTLKRYDRPLTPCQRLIDHPAVAEKIKEGLRDKRSKLDPLFLLHEIRGA